MADKKPHKREVVPTPKPAAQQDAGAGRSGKKLSFSLPGKKTASKQMRSASGGGRRIPVRGIALALGVVCALMVAGTIGIVVLSHTDAFTITSINAESTEHVSSTDIASLAGVPEGTTLLNYDETLIVENLQRNPWIKQVRISREFPDRLKVTVTERTVKAFVIMDSGSVIWCLGDDSVWIEPIKIPVAEGQSITEAALSTAVEKGALLITDVPQTVNPVAGAPADDDVFEALRAYREELSNEFWSQIVSINASSIEGISCILDSGVEISLGSPTSIQSKETVIQQLLAKYPNRLTYINVRVPANPSYRMVESESVEGGTGAIGDVNQG